MFEKNPTKIKPILTNGPILALMKEWRTRLYLDQRGWLADHLRIKRVPAVVSQNGKQLKVVEYDLRTAE
jgi:conjugal transfer pilus assembly protein TraW